MGASLHGPYIVTFVLFSLGITVLALRLGRRLTPVQDQPSLADVPSRVVAVSLPDGGGADGAEAADRAVSVTAPAAASAAAGR